MADDVEAATPVQRSMQELFCLAMDGKVNVIEDRFISFTDHQSALAAANEKYEDVAKMYRFSITERNKLDKLTDELQEQVDALQQQLAAARAEAVADVGLKLRDLSGRFWHYEEYTMCQRERAGLTSDQVTGAHIALDWVEKQIQQALAPVPPQPTPDATVIENIVRGARPLNNHIPDTGNMVPAGDYEALAQRYRYLERQVANHSGDANKMVPPQPTPAKDYRAARGCAPSVNGLLPEEAINGEQPPTPGGE